MAKNCTCKVVAFLNKPISFFGVLVAVAVVVAKAPWAVEPPESDHPKCEGLRKSNQSWSFTKIGQGREFLVPNLLHKLRTIRVVPCCHWSSPYGLCLSGEGHKANKETIPCLRSCFQEVKNNAKRLFQLCFNHDIFTKPTHQNDDKLPVNGYSKSRHLLHCK